MGYSTTALATLVVIENELLKAELRQLRIRNLAAEKRLIADARRKEGSRPRPPPLNSSIQQQMLKQLTARLDQWADLLFPVHAQMMPIQVGPGFASVGDALPRNHSST